MFDPPGLVLAPMQGVTEAPMRALLTELGGFDLCVSEFVRVAQNPLTEKVVIRMVPELRRAARTPAGVPVQVQLLGGDPERLALAAQTAVRAGATGIDLNFGCPAPTVNRHDGGAVLLKDPVRLQAIVAAVRQAVPAALPVSAKLRLGWQDPRDIEVTAQRAAEGGASWLTIHARTRAQGYAPPADWHAIGRVRRALAIPVVANGDLFTVDDVERCAEITGCRHFMLGRGALADPTLARRVAAWLRGEPPEVAPTIDNPWPAWLVRLAEVGRPLGQDDRQLLKRAKQWLRLRWEVSGWTGFDVAKRAATFTELQSILPGLPQT
ncbi:MAG: tRNA-dihydrouridine synthase family protein [Deltaproteobacteria bacterium]|nr:tRNA-dihydrouridine synthase family protein [Deltaproteobacteria bacterium]